MKGLFTLLCSMLLIVSLGCSSLPQKPPRAQMPVQERNIESVKKELQERSEYFNDLTASSRLTIKSDERKTGLRQILLLQKGPYIRMETLGFFGQTSAYFASNTDGIKIYYPEKGKYFTGRLSSHNLLNFLGIDMGVADLVMLLTGNLPEEGKYGRETLSFMPKEGTYLLSQTNGDGPYSERLVWLEPENLHLVTIKYYGTDTVPVVEFRYDEYRDVNGFALPTRIVITRPAQGVEITLQHISVEVNKGISKTAFLLPVPKGVEVINLDNQERR